MSTRKMIENRKYILARNDPYFDFYVIKRKGKISVWRKTEEEDRKYLNEDYVDIKLLLRKRDSSCYLDSCFLYLRNEDDECFIIELLSEEVLLKFNFHELGKICKRTFYIYDENKEEEVQDKLIIFCNKEKKVYSMWSLLEGYIFKPYEYTTIEYYSEGVILDGKIAVNNCGYSLDISGYEEITGPVYYNKKNDNYLFLVDEDGVLFDLMREKGEEGNIFEIETNYNIYTFNSETQELKSSSIPPDDYYDLSKYSDIAYEGHSRLELGLED